MNRPSTLRSLNNQSLHALALALGIVLLLLPSRAAYAGDGGHWTVDGPMQKAQQQDGKVAETDGWEAFPEGAKKSDTCRKLKLHQDGAIALEIKNTQVLLAKLASSEELRLVVWGPAKGEDPGPATCYAVGLGEGHKYAPGHYKLQLGSRFPRDASYSIVLLDSARSSRQNARMTKDAGVGADLDHRAATRSFPQLSLGSLLHSDRLRQRVLEQAPTGNFVYPYRDLKAAEVENTLINRSAEVKAAAALAGSELTAPPLPAKDEPLLFIEGLSFLTTDSALIDIKDPELFSLFPAGGPRLPGNARQLWVDAEQARRVAGSEDRPLLAKLDQAQRAARGCAKKAKRTFRKNGKKLKLQIGRLSQKKRLPPKQKKHLQALQEKLVALNAHLASNRFPACAKTPAARRIDQTLDELAFSRLARHTKVLKAMADRFAP